MNKVSDLVDDGDIRSYISSLRIKYLEWLADQTLQAKDDEDTTNFTCSNITFLPNSYMYDSTNVDGDGINQEKDEIVFEKESKLFILNKDSNQWEQKAVGPTRILSNNSTKKSRILMRQMRTHKVALHAWIDSPLVVQPHDMSSRSIVLTLPSLDIADDGGEVESLVYCLRFPLDEDATKFANIMQELQDDVLTQECKSFFE